MNFLSFWKRTLRSDTYLEVKRHYPSLVPSGFRKALIGGDLTAPVLPVKKSHYYKNLDKRGRSRQTQLNLMIQRYGRAIGNLLAQQYGVTSESIDVTDSPAIAAFFATRKWPVYNHYAGTNQNRNGVIYRISQLKDQPETVEHVEFIFEAVYAKYEGIDKPFVFTIRRSTEDLKAADKLKELDEFFEKHGKRSDVRLISLPGLLSCDTMVKTVQDSAPVWGELLDIDNTRFVRQRAGILRAPIHFMATTAERIQGIPLPNAGILHALPPLALIDDVLAVENLIPFPALEAFFFKHTSTPVVGLTKETLWPRPGHDKLLEVIATIALLEHPDFVGTDLDVEDLFDFETGLFDRGYYESD